MIDPVIIDAVITAGHRMLNECSHVHDGAKADLSEALTTLYEAAQSQPREKG